MKNPGKLKKGVLSILSRSEAVLRVIKIRKKITDEERSRSVIKNELDGLLHDLIGPPAASARKIDEILTKAFQDEIKARTAVVAIHEIVTENEYAREKNSGDQQDIEKLYQKGYR